MQEGPLSQCYDMIATLPRTCFFLFFSGFEYLYLQTSILIWYLPNIYWIWIHLRQTFPGIQGRRYRGCQRGPGTPTLEKRGAGIPATQPQTFSPGSFIVAEQALVWALWTEVHFLVGHKYMTFVTMLKAMSFRNLLLLFVLPSLWILSSAFPLHVSTRGPGTILKWGGGGQTSPGIQGNPYPKLKTPQCPRISFISGWGVENSVEKKSGKRVENSILKLIYREKIPEHSYFEHFNNHSFWM